MIIFLLNVFPGVVSLAIHTPLPAMAMVPLPTLRLVDDTILPPKSKTDNVAFSYAFV